MIKQGLHTLGNTFPTHGTFWLMSDVGRGSRAATRSGHDVRVTGPDINLDFPDAQFDCTARLGSSDVAPDRRPTEKQAPAGKLAGFGALGTHKAGRSASESWCGRAGRRYTDSTGHDCHCDQQERGDGPRHCICHKLGTIRFARAAGLTLVCTRTAGPGCAKKKLKHFCGSSACHNEYIEEGCSGEH